MKRLAIAAAAVFTFALLMASPLVYAAPQAAPQLSGKAVETMNSGGYTYVQLENSGKKIWVAVPQMKITKGQKMSFKPGLEMTNFESKTLKRTFDKIYFSEGPAR